MADSISLDADSVSEFNGRVGSRQEAAEVKYILPTVKNQQMKKAEKVGGKFK
jgi:hypothetical protein